MTSRETRSQESEVRSQKKETEVRKRAAERPDEGSRAFQGPELGLGKRFRRAATIDLNQSEVRSQESGDSWFWASAKGASYTSLGQRPRKQSAVQQKGCKPAPFSIMERAFSPSVLKESVFLGLPQAGMASLRPQAIQPLDTLSRAGLPWCRRFAPHHERNRGLWRLSPESPRTSAEDAEPGRGYPQVWIMSAEGRRRGTFHAGTAEPFRVVEPRG